MMILMTRIVMMMTIQARSACVSARPHTRTTTIVTNEYTDNKNVVVVVVVVDDDDGDGNAGQIGLLVAAITNAAQ